MVSPTKTLKKMLFVFDFDHTIIAENSETHIFKLFPEEKLPKSLEDAYESGKWMEFMQKVLESLRNHGQTPENIKQCLQKLELMPGFCELFKFLREIHADCIIVSGANLLFIEWILEKHGIFSDFCEIFSNPAEIRDGVIKVSAFHSHFCASCFSNMCKKVILQEFLAKNPGIYSKIAYVGDGGNDFCPLAELREGDAVFFRKGFALEKRLKEFGEKLACEKRGWENGKEIVEFVKEFIIV